MKLVNSNKNTFQSTKQPYFISVFIICLVSGICYPFSDIIGYRAVALILLFTVSLLAMKLSLFPVLLAAFLSALIWDFFYIPPHFTFLVSKSEDVLMLFMYFIIAILNGVLTSRIKHFEGLAIQREERVNALKLYDSLFNSISHEFRTPIATILGATDNLLVQNSKFDEITKQKLYVEIYTATERLNRLVDNFLNVSRLESGSIKPKLDWCDINELLHSVVNRLEKELVNHQIVVKIPQNIPYFKLDFALMEQAIYNIVYNSSLYTPNNSTITLTAANLSNQCFITIADNGKGFQQHELEQVFTKFYRSNEEKTGGLGLGLSITKGFIEAHGGTIRVENVAGSGSLFTIIIPTEVNWGNDMPT
ncbi:Adaptive-response sensory-kinase SasA [Emticicia aquatica]|uniref:histidine kinase n=1 Tax=Emticicia aquatica TaxID=1681835 RepID=A0ABN8EVC5_9BACT|nr:ATP-binding protein [Emticicia aquatica]CAH0995925.1 Adaptive-response sensory-kinase SasA [Emticicia aquatica]